MPRAFEGAAAQKIAVREALQNVDRLIEHADDTLDTLKNLKYLLEEFIEDQVKAGSK